MPSPRTPYSRSFFAVCIAAVASFCLMANGAFAAAAVSVDQGGDYAGRMLDKIIEVWAPPLTIKNDARVRVSVSVDERGQVTACKILAASGAEAFDASTCEAVRRCGSFGTPPYSAPMDAHLTFWNGTPKGRADQPGKENAAEAEAAGSAATLPQKERAVVPPSAAPSARPGPAAQTGQATGNSAPLSAASAKTSSQALPTYGEPGTAETPTTAPSLAAPAPANRVAVPDAAEADKKNAKYRRTVTRQLRAAIIIPAATAPGEYRTRIALTISPQGEITDFKVLAPTGDKLLDKYVQRGIRRAGGLPQPPADLKGRLDITLTLVRR